MPTPRIPYLVSGCYSAGIGSGFLAILFPFRSTMLQKHYKLTDLIQLLPPYTRGTFVYAVLE